MVNISQMFIFKWRFGCSLLSFLFNLTIDETQRQVPPQGNIACLYFDESRSHTFCGLHNAKGKKISAETIYVPEIELATKNFVKLQLQDTPC